MVLQQDLNIANTLLSAHKGEGDHSLCQQHKTTQNTHVNKGLKKTIIFIEVQKQWSVLNKQLYQ